MDKAIDRVSWYDDRFYKITTREQPEGLTCFEAPNGLFHVYLPSTTTKHGIINKPFLAKWRGDIGNELADKKMHESQDRGTRIHYALEVLFNGGTVEFKQEFLEGEAEE